MADAPVTPPRDDYDWKEDWEIWRLRFSAPQWLRDNPGLVLTGLYVGTSIVGMFYVFMFFRRFRINVLEFTEVSDFLMVVLREPVTVALALMGLVFYWVYMRVSVQLTAWGRKHVAWIRGNAEKRARSRELARKMAPWMQFCFVTVYAALFILLYSAYQASRLRDGKYPQVTVEYKFDAAADRAPFTATLMGSTSRFLFVYRPETRRAEAIPFESIARLSWDARSRRQREADAAKAAPAPPVLEAPKTP